MDLAVEHFNLYYMKIPEFFDFNGVSIECVDSETDDKLMEYKMGWNEEKECLEMTKESYTDPEIKKGMNPK